MKNLGNCNLKERIICLAEYVIQNGSTVREAAGVFGISKSTVHKDLSTRLASFDCDLYEKVRLILEKNKAERHIRGGNATKQKYLACRLVKK